MRLALVDSWRSAALPIYFVSASDELFLLKLSASKTKTTHLMNSEARSLLPKH